MPHTYSLTDGATTISLSASGVMTRHYAMAAPQTERNQPAPESVTDTVDLYVYGANGAAVQAKVQAIDALLAQAIRRQTARTGPRVFVQVQLSSDGDVWRSEVLNGYHEIGENTLSEWANNKAETTLYLERAPYWEGPETGIPLTNGNGTWNGSTANTTGLNVFNCNDGSGTSPNICHNYLQIAASDVTGSIPAPVKLELKNLTGGSVQWSTFYLATNASIDPANFAHWLEGESRASGGSTTADGAASNDNVLTLTATTTGALMRWTLSAAQLQRTRGRWLRILLQTWFHNATDAQQLTVNAAILDSANAVVLWRGPDVVYPPVLAHPILDLGMLPFPPAAYDATWGALTLQLTWRVLSGTATVRVDAMQLTPLDAYRVIDTRLTYVAANGLIVDNGIDGVAYTEESGVRYPYLTPRGNPLMVYPGQLQRIYVQASYAGNNSDPLHKWAARAWYRPRRWTV